MSDGYGNVQAGKLKLKKSDKVLSVKGDKKKKRRRKKKKEEDYPTSPTRGIVEFFLPFFFVFVLVIPFFLFSFLLFSFVFFS